MDDSQPSSPNENNLSLLVYATVNAVFSAEYLKEEDVTTLLV